MIVLSNLSAQTLTPGQSVTFDNVKLWTGNAECFSSQLPKSVRLNPSSGCCCNQCPIWEVSFSGNVTSATAGAAVQLHVTVNGQSLVETEMDESITTANVLKNVSTETRYQLTCSDANRLSITNTGNVAVTVGANSAFVLERVA